MTLERQEQEDRYSVTYSDFNESGTYRIVLYASDSDGLTSRPLEVTLELEAQIQTEHELYLPMIIR